MQAETATMEQIGDYIVRRLIGEGGMGKVYEAQERLSKRRVALKVLHPELAKSEQGRRLFTNEMQILAHLEHPNIVRSLASTEVDGELVMVLEYLDGNTLRSVLTERGSLPWGEAVSVERSVAAALAAAHGQTPPIIHRDLKPENIMVLSDGAVKVMDFGIAKVIEALNQTNTQSVGTLQYMSPEQIDAHTIDHRSDLYCLGLIFYELLVGKPPFTSASPRQLLNLQCTQEPPPLPDAVRATLPKRVEELLFQLLEKAPEDRPYFAVEVAERLEPFETAGPTSILAGSTAAEGRGSRASHTTPRRASVGAAPADADAGPSERATGEGPAEPRDGAAPEATEDQRTSRSSGSGPRTAPAASAAASRAASERGDTPVRADTIALVERLEARRDIPTKYAIAVVVVLSLIAGAIGYFVKVSTVDDSASSGSTADRRASPPDVRSRKR
jgi:tRNA A-37 threonylcarbamoyl transferase component Bud32